MGNMGTIPATGYESSVVQTFSSPTGTSHTMTYTASVNDMILVINNVIQEPTVAYTTSGTTLTTGTLISGDTMYIIYLALTRQTSAPGADTVTNAMIVDNAINSEHYTDASIDLAHMSVNSIDSDQDVDASIDNAHVADDAVNSDELAAGAVDLAHMSATGTASSSTFLRGDNAWAAAGGGKLVQIKYADIKTILTGSTTIPHDTTIPQITEGDQYLTLAITPTTTSNALLIEVQVMISSNTGEDLIIAIFNTDVHATDAQAVSAMYMVTNTTTQCMSIQYYYIPGITSATTWRLRCGTHQAGTTNINGGSSNQKFGGKANTSMTITEIVV